MGLILNQIQDPRSQLAKVRRKDLQKFIERNGIKDIHPWMPQTLMVQKLQAKGINRIDAPVHHLGQPERPNMNGVSTEEPAAHTIDAAALLEAEWQAPKSIAESIDKMTMGELKNRAKQLGLKQKRTDKKEDLKALLRKAMQ